MSQIHLQEKKQFKNLFLQEQVDHIEERFKILEGFLQSENHMTAAELHEQLAGNGQEYTPEFVLDTLNLLCRYGFAQKNKFDNGVTRFEHRHLGHHHDHMICTKCHKIIEFKNDDLENLQLTIATANGFHMLQHKMEIYGICSDCLKERVSLMPLINARAGERLTIKDFTGGASVRMRLLTMGLRPGDELEVITNQNQGQVVVAADYQRYALGRGLANKILVEPITVV